VQGYWSDAGAATSDHKPVAAALVLPLVHAPPQVHPHGSIRSGERGSRRPCKLHIVSAVLVGSTTWQRLAELLQRRPGGWDRHDGRRRPSGQHHRRGGRRRRPPWLALVLTGECLGSGRTHVRNHLNSFGFN
jgi:hypothetical protein